MRQLFVSLVCQALPAFHWERAEVHCSPEENSGEGFNGCKRMKFATVFTKANVPMKHSNGSTLMYHNITTSTRPMQEYAASNWAEGDVVIAQAGRHKLQEHIESAVGTILKRSSGRVNVVWIETAESNFANRTGPYDTPCVSKAPHHEPRNDGAHLTGLTGIISLRGYGDGGLGDAKVGPIGPLAVNPVNQAGKFDCLHFCLPGPPDAVVSALVTLLLQQRINPMKPAIFLKEKLKAEEKDENNKDEEDIYRWSRQRKIGNHSTFTKYGDWPSIDDTRAQGGSVAV